MDKKFLILMVAVLFVATGCKGVRERRYIPEAQNDKTYTEIGGGEKTQQENGMGYTINVPVDNYRYEKDYDDGAVEEKWERIRRDDVEIKVTTYKNTDEETAKRRFLREYDDYVFEDLTGYPLCGTEFDGDSLWFNLYVSEETVYIVSWEYPRNTDEELKTELAGIAETFKLSE